MECLAFPFIDQGKDLGYTTEREEKKKENNQEEGSPGAMLPFSSRRCVLLVLQTIMEAHACHDPVRH
jgi:hypothetical protein